MASVFNEYALKSQFETSIYLQVEVLLLPDISFFFFLIFFFFFLLQVGVLFAHEVVKLFLPNQKKSCREIMSS